MSELGGNAGSAGRAAVGLVRLYQRWLSPVTGAHCRFAPTCSSYAIVSIQRRGLRVGGWLALRRLARCHPFHSGGFDPVPRIRMDRGVRP